MRLGSPIEFTYLGHLQNVHYCREAIDEKGVQRMLEKISSLGKFQNHALPAIFAIDYTNRQYLFVADLYRQLAERNLQEFIEGGVDFMLYIFHKDDFKVFNEKVFNANLNFLAQCPQEDRYNYIFSFTYRIKNKAGGYAQIFQRGSFITAPETGRPLFMLGMAMDITAYKKDNVITHCIEKISFDCENRMSKTLVASNLFYPNEEDTLLTKQEKIVLQWLAEGLSSKQIADKLYVSEFTVINHRKNMLKKSNTQNVAQLVAFGIRNKFI